MKTCSVCGNQCNNEDKFCRMCGTKLVIHKDAPIKQMKFCMKCGGELFPGAAFCMKCGTQVGSTGADTGIDHPRRQVALNDQRDIFEYRSGTNWSEDRAALPVEDDLTARVPGREAVLPVEDDRTVRVRGRGAGVPVPPPSNAPDPVQIRSNQALPISDVPTQPDSGASVPATAPPGNSSLYVVEFMGALFKAHNIPVIIYMLMNIVFIAAFSFLVFQDIRIAIPAGLVVYLISLCIALSPFGESLLRFQTKCSPVTDQEVLQRVMPIFNEAKRRATIAANAEGRSIPDDIELFYKDDNSVNAFATGRKTICFTKGILNVTDEMLLATFEHELGHIAHHDTDSILLITVGNLLFSAIITFFRFGIFLGEIMFHIIGAFAGGEEGIFMILMGSLSRFLSLILVDLFMLIWTGIGNLLVLKTSRSCEYKADEFAFRCGMGRQLQNMLVYLEGGNLVKTSGLFATLSSSHPHSADRIAALQQLEATSVPVVR